MDSYGKLDERNGRYTLTFKRHFANKPKNVFDAVTEPANFVQWYPFATGRMDLRLGGKIHFDDGEGAEYEALITELDYPRSFAFREMEDVIELSFQEETARSGSKMVFVHTFDEAEMAMYIAAGWHRCLDVLSQLVHGETVEWKDNSEELREIYKEKFN
ncbi:SRPBCC domain-containing protein [Sediminibacillus halophilus]|uniref:Uncharacterized conserved protein YndB, AHSA1/START domain n=1 Tax=Sediminibacillus halophilus TaxID=482461 RepID=A0A1G9WSD9_9BACI|nr:SRPBCC domain-containing protein [Sediminibacillus halophilus]SDM87357.1 Uncharacterized conserved protein YndB, AHSA1/START domain [Sediminibacillus halophilus]